MFTKNFMGGGGGGTGGNFHGGKLTPEMPPRKSAPPFPKEQGKTPLRKLLLEKVAEKTLRK